MQNLKIETINIDVKAHVFFLSAEFAYFLHNKM